MTRRRAGRHRGNGGCGCRLADDGGTITMKHMSALRLALVLSSAIGIVARPAARDQPPAPNQPGTTWTDAQLRQSVELARVGRKLTPRRWPNDARVAVCLSFDTDSEAP